MLGMLVMDKFIRLADRCWVSPQLTPPDVATAKALGVTLIINNRPDGEEPGQPKGADIERTARAAGLAYVAIPVSGMAIGARELDAFDAATAEAGGDVLAFCRSGTRSTLLRALSRARAGDEVDALLEEAADAGYNLSGARGLLDSVSRARG